MVFQCLCRSFSVLMNYKHGDSNTRFYKIWAGIVSRGSDSSNLKYYENIAVSDSWKEYKNFKDDMFEAYTIHRNEYGEKNTTIDRNDGTKGYCKENCSWKTYEEQAKNRKSNIIISYNNQTMCLYDWCKLLKINYRMALTRIIKFKWSIEDTFSIPSKVGQKINQKTILTYNNKSMSIKDWGEELGILPCTIRNRISRGWSVEMALSKEKRNYVFSH